VRLGAEQQVVRGTSKRSACPVVEGLRIGSAQAIEKNTVTGGHTRRVQAGMRVVQQGGEHDMDIAIRQKVLQ
jgi:hypothetical protein